MGQIGYGYGSEWHLLRYLGYHRERLDQQVICAVGCSSVSWKDFEFSSKYDPLKQDVEWKGIQFLPNGERQEQWKAFWPQSGNAQNWDAVGKAHFETGEEWLLVEAKAHIRELESKCGATHATSKEMIRQALLSTQAAMQVSSPFLENWLNGYYQYCNRLAMLHFLRNICKPSIPARLVLIYFYGEKHAGMNGPASIMEWETALKEVDECLGVVEPNPLSRFIHRIYLPVNPNF